MIVCLVASEGDVGGGYGEVRGGRGGEWDLV